MVSCRNQDQAVKFSKTYFCRTKGLHFVDGASTVCKMYTLRAHNKPNQTYHTMEQMVIDFVLNTWDDKA